MLAWLFGLAQQISTDEAENLIATNPGAVKGRIQADRWLALFDADTTLNPINVKKYVDSLFNNLKSHVTAGENEVAKIKEARLSVERLSESMEPWTEEKKAKITLEIQVLLSTMKRDIESKISHITLDAKKDSDAISSIRHDLERSLLTADQAASTRTNELLDSLKKHVDSGRIDSDREWAKLTATYGEALTLKAPSVYWSTKGRVHRSNAIWFACATAALSIVACIALSCIYIYLFGTTEVSKVPTWSQVLPAALASVLALWFIKTFIRITLSHIHLSMDASERSVMIESFLSMSKEHSITRDQRTALFTAIFRPTANGLVGDESPPVPLLELLKGGKG